ncbi:rhodanese-like domain-containing protein [Jejudonia soesokkakensis]|uniref:Rhodanese-like domain-containing protein n=1 Tax=Jejudonia soesokkakensis TaxID=1323432 RepID=A0ABW2MSF3_9FLAO
MDLQQKQWAEQLAEDPAAVILDVRTDAEVEEGMIPNAKQMDIYNSAAFIENVKQLDTSKNYYVYCRSGGRSAQACAILRSLGVENAYNLMGGFENWEGDKTV